MDLLFVGTFCADFFSSSGLMAALAVFCDDVLIDVFRLCKRKQLARLANVCARFSRLIDRHVPNAYHTYLNVAFLAEHSCMITTEYMWLNGDSAPIKFGSHEPSSSWTSFVLEFPLDECELPLRRTAVTMNTAKATASSAGLALPPLLDAFGLCWWPHFVRFAHVEMASTALSARTLACLNGCFSSGFQRVFSCSLHFNSPPQQQWIGHLEGLLDFFWAARPQLPLEVVFDPRNGFAFPYAQIVDWLMRPSDPAAARNAILQKRAEKRLHIKSHFCISDCIPMRKRGAHKCVISELLNAILQRFSAAANSRAFPFMVMAYCCREGHGGHIGGRAPFRQRRMVANGRYECVNFERGADEDEFVIKAEF